jgi:predicted Zn-dependent peptidase
LAEALDYLGATLEILAGFDTLTVSLFVLKRNLFAAADLVFDMLTDSVFPEDELRIEKDHFIQNLRISNEKTSVVASREFRKTLFGPLHPYGNLTEEADAIALQSADLRSHAANHLHLISGYFLGAVEDTDLERLRALFPSPSPKVQPVTVPPIETGVSHTVSKEGSVQSSIRLGKRCIPKGDDPEYFSAVMANHILGGYFGSRLMKNIREEKGLTYGIYSAMQHFHRGSFWAISAEVNQENTQKAIDEIQKEIKRMHEEPVPLGELEVARNYFIGSWQSDNATLFAVAEKIRNLHEFQLPSNYYDKLLGHLQRVTPEQVMESSRRLFGFEGMVEIRVG